MIASLRMFYSTVGRKLVMALTGLFLCLFLLEHLYANLLLYKIDAGFAFNEYSAWMTGNILIRTVEFGLFAGFLIHIIDGLYLTLQNRKARPVRYAVSQQTGNSTWFSRNMGLTGSVVLVFLVVHLKSFFVSHRITHSSDNSMAYDVAIAFQENWYAALYLFAMVILGAHLNHGFQSAFQTIGVNNKYYKKGLKIAGTVFSLLIMIGFGSFPVMFYFDFFGVASNILGK
ncbi:MAG: succinate dehydrogenase cytochrome b subunit [Bacteroidia bacterium]|nr:succinate dehydrogenase cytochrome b subunit [Bacteroidia bacterium]